MARCLGDASCVLALPPATDRLRFFHGGWHLWCVADQEYTTLRRYALPIAEDHGLIVALNLQVPDEERLPLGRDVVAWEEVFGPSSRGFDSWKGSFLFPLLLTLVTGTTLAVPVGQSLVGVRRQDRWQQHGCPVQRARTRLKFEGG